MALVRCSECGGNVSTTAYTCPHCGYAPGEHGCVCENCYHHDYNEDLNNFTCSHSGCSAHGRACPAWEPRPDYMDYD